MVDHVFVFGSNLAGRHGKGAALHAYKYYGAARGIGEGITGQAYAIPTKGFNLEQRSLVDVELSILNFINYARFYTDVEFRLTPIGTGLAGFSKPAIWDILVRNGLPENVLLTSSWVSG